MRLHQQESDPIKKQCCDKQFFSSNFQLYLHQHVILLDSMQMLAQLNIKLPLSSSTILINNFNNDLARSSVRILYP